MVTIGTASTPRTFIQAVNRCLASIGESDTATLLNPTRRISMAMRHVNDARDEVFYRTLWEWRRGHLRINLVANTMWYVLPTDYQKMATGVSLNQKAGPLDFISYETLINMYPDLRAFPPGTGVSDLTTVSQLALQTENYGASLSYCIVDGYIGLVPIPDAEFVAQEISLYASYWKQ